MREFLLYLSDPEGWERVREKAEAFAAAYVGSNILQDDIFPVIENYARRKGARLELLRIPVKDPEFFSCSFVRKERVFLVVNTTLPLGQQNFSAARELWQIRKYLEGEDSCIKKTGSIFWKGGREDERFREAEAFAAMLLVPVDKLDQQIRIYGLSPGDISPDDVLMLMEVFAVPYEVMVERLFEERIITSEAGSRLLTVRPEELKERISRTGRAERWSLSPPGSVKYGSILENVRAARSSRIVTQEKAEQDKEKFQRILQRLAD